MANLFIRTYTFVDGTTAYGSQVEAEVGNIVTVLNNLNTAATNWGQVSVLHASNVPLISDCSSGSQHIADFKNNSVIKASVSSAGLVTCVGLTTTSGITNSGAAIAAGSQKITGLANGTVSTDAAAFGQIPTFASAVLASGATTTTLTSATFAVTVVTASITPTSASHRIKISASFHVNTASNISQFTIERGTTNLMDASGGAQTGGAGIVTDSTQVSMVWIDSPATTSSTTYTVYGANASASGNVLVGNGRTWTIILEEIV